jgi:4-amino-4-deoxychorismate lyase
MILVNGQPSDRVDALDRGLAYGDGVFRTVRTAAGAPLWWRDQYAKLACDCAALALGCPDEAVLRDEVGRVAGGGAALAKIILTRGAGMRGYAPPSGQTATRIVMGLPLPAHAHPESADGIAARWCTLRLARQPRLAGIKHLNRLENVLARAEWDDPAILEGILCDTDGMLIGGVMSNLLWVAQGILHTPDLSASGVAGVTRTRVLRAAPRLGLDTRIDRFPAAAILAAEEVMICNSILGVRPIVRLDHAHCPSAGWSARLNTALHEETD